MKQKDVEAKESVLIHLIYESVLIHLHTLWIVQILAFSS